MSWVRVLSLTLVASCRIGAPEEVDESGSPLRGKYRATVVVEKYTGDCKDYFTYALGLNVDFNEHGDVVSPLPEVVKCQTSYRIKELLPLRISCYSPWGSGSLEAGPSPSGTYYCGPVRGSGLGCTASGNICLKPL